MNAAPIPRPIARQAAQWFLRLQQDDSAPAHQACAAWRAAHADHERAWQLAAQFSAQVKAIPPEVARSALQHPAALGRRATLKTLTSLVVLGSLGVTLQRTGTWDGLLADVRTGVGERRQLTLEDGSTLHLNTDTCVDIHFTANERRVTLRRGELYLSTGVDPRPLRVQSKWGTFQPLGTRFSVRQYPASDLLQVFEGKVAATSPGGQTLTIDAGGQASVDAKGVSQAVAAPANAGWLDGVLRVERMPLGELIDELARYRHGWTRCAPEVAGLRVSGTYQLNDTDAALAALAMAFPVRVRYVTPYWVTLVPANAGA
ncbi:FecR domain-containing protein [Pseudomonas sp. NPDC089554]|uniref:FecR domain-containing protein n=1 Tax=Pseudomonas sp. NPDC089554 TaxID=3390653 RepID=UPI003CFC3842